MEPQLNVNSKTDLLFILKELTLVQSEGWAADLRQFLKKPLMLETL